MGVRAVSPYVQIHSSPRQLGAHIHSTARRGEKRPTGAARGYTLDFAYISVYMQLMPFFECAVFGVSKATGRLPRRCAVA